MAKATRPARLAVDIGGTFTDVTLEVGGRRVTLKVLTVTSAPERGVMRAVHEVIQESGLKPGAMKRSLLAASWTMPSSRKLWALPANHTHRNTRGNSSPSCGQSGTTRMNSRSPVAVAMVLRPGTSSGQVPPLYAGSSGG